MTSLKYLESIAEHSGLDAYYVRTRNLYVVGERNITSLRPSV